MAILLALAALTVIFLAVRAIRATNKARQDLRQTSLPAGDLVSIDTSSEGLAELRQDNIISARHGISGRPDRIVKRANGIMPVELKSGNAPQSGPYDSHLAQLAVYCRQHASLDTRVG